MNGNISTKEDEVFKLWLAGALTQWWTSKAQNKPSYLIKHSTDICKEKQKGECDHKVMLQPSESFDTPVYTPDAWNLMHCCPAMKNSAHMFLHVGS